MDSRGGDELIVRTNRGAPGFRVVRVPRVDPAPEHWREVRPGRAGVLVDAMDVLVDHVVVLERRNARPELWVVPIEGSDPREIPFAEEARQVRFALRHHLESDRVRFEYSSLTTPRRLVAYDVKTGERDVEAELQTLEGYDPREYVSERLWAPARDGARIPVSLVSRRDRRDGRAGGPAPVLLFGYGTYGVTIDPAFDATRLGLLDRGFVYAIAHIRGGQALGREWYEQGRGLQKIHTF